jgi:hypothetical protein
MKKKDQQTEVDGMKVQLRVVMEDLTQRERQLFHFLMILTHEKNHAHKGLFHFLTSFTHERNYAQ